MTGLFPAGSEQNNPLGNAIRSGGTGRYTFGLALSAGLAGLMYGYDTVAVSGAIDFLRIRYALGPALEGLIISSVMIGAVVAAPAAGSLADRFGRRHILMAGAGLFLAASLLSAATATPMQLIVTRAVGGMGIGLTAALAVTYITECAPAHIRGTLAFSYQMLAVSGIFLANVANYLIASHGAPHWDVFLGWRWMLGIGAVPAAALLLAMLASPESPRFLIQQGRYDEGFAVLEHISGTGKARVEADDILDSVRREREMGARFVDLFRPGLRRALLIGVFLAVANQAIGMNVISYYGPVLFRSLGFAGDTEFLAAACVAGVELVGTVIGMYLIDAVGRKWLMVLGASFMAVFAIGISYGFAAGQSHTALAFIMLFAAAFSFSMGPVPWLMIPELFPTYLRGRATGLCTMFLLLANLVVGQLSPVMVAALGGAGTFLVFAVLNAVCLGGVMAIVPETADRTLEDIEENFRRHDDPVHTEKIAVSLADSQIRRAETTLARVENERMQALGIIEEAERRRIAAQKRLIELQNESMRREVVRKLDDYRRLVQESARRAESTVTIDHVPEAPSLPETDPARDPRRIADVATVARDAGATVVTSDVVGAPDVTDVSGAVRTTADAQAASPAAGLSPIGDSSYGPGPGRTGGLTMKETLESVMMTLPDATAEPVRTGLHLDGDGTPQQSLPAPQDEAELRRENAALRQALDSLDRLMKR